MLSGWVIYPLVFLGKLAEVSLSALRTQMIVKGQRVLGALMAAAEYAIWFVVTASALTKYSSDPLMIGLLILAFALGQIVGSLIEEKMALGNCMMSIVFTERQKAMAAADILRSRGFALTVFNAEGREASQRTVLTLTLRRKHVKLARTLILEVDPKAVLSLTPMVNIEGGTLARKVSVPK